MEGLIPQISERLKACTPEWRATRDRGTLLQKAQGIEADLAETKGRKSHAINTLGGPQEQGRGSFRKPLTCHYCNKIGHIRRNCRKRIRDEGEEGVDSPVNQRRNQPRDNKNSHIRQQGDGPRA